MIGLLTLALATGGGRVPAPVRLMDNATWTTPVRVSNGADT